MPKKLKTFWFNTQAFWLPVLALTAIGLIFVYSSSSIYALQKYHDEMLFFKKQLVFIIPSLFSAYLGIKVPLSFWDKHIHKFFIITLLLCFSTHLPIIGQKVNGAARWINLRFFVLQPSEILKAISIIYVSYVLAQNIKKIWRLWPVIIALFSLIIQPDFGSTMILLSGIVFIIFVSGFPFKAILITFFFGFPAIILAMIAEPYRVKRLTTFLSPFEDPLGAGFQVIQSLVAIANGGFGGKGIGGSQQKLFFLPEAHTDFIVAVIAEELGFLGIFVLAFVYLFMFFIFTKSFNINKIFREKLLIAGIFAMFASSVIINFGVAAGFFPTKGLPLPFVSSGGSAIIVNFFLIGLITQLYHNSQD